MGQPQVGPKGKEVGDLERPNQIALIDTDQNEHGCIRMANEAKKTNTSQASLSNFGYCPRMPLGWIIRVHPEIRV